MKVISASGGLCGITTYDLSGSNDGIRPNHRVKPWRSRTVIGRLANFLAWDAGWGFPLEGGPLPVPCLRDLLPVLTISRGGIRFLAVSAKPQEEVCDGGVTGR